MRLPEQKPNGFALIVSMALMSLILLLVISLATLTTLETHNATQAKQNLEAQQNALTALGIALGQLQKYAGPDQRVTARADLQAGQDAPNAFWTGVYGSSIAANYDDDPVKIATDLTDPAKVDTNGTGTPAKLLSWLVSGNESIAFNPEDDVGPSGEIVTPPTNIPYSPDMTIDGLTETTQITATDLKINNQPARVLVGPGSTASASDYVLAPVVRMEGASSNGTGGYAWWIGDEGVKARANLPLVTEDADKPNAFVNATRTAVELMSTGPSDDATLDGERIAESYSPSESQLTRSENLGDLKVLFPDLAKETNGKDPTLKYRFHDLTTHSQSVLADTYAGGLKRDLSILLDESYNTKLDPSDPTANANRMWTLLTKEKNNYADNGYAVPTWGHLRSFAQTRVPSGPNPAMDPILPIHDKDGFADHVGLGPVITYASFGIRVSVQDGPSPGSIVYLDMFPMVVIWNPYNFTIKAPPTDADGGNYEVGIYLGWAVEMDLEVQDPDTGAWSFRDRFHLQKDADGSSDGFEYFTFRLDCPDIPPGQSLIFSLPHTSSRKPYTRKNVLKNIEPEESSYVYTPFIYNNGEYQRLNKDIDDGVVTGIAKVHKNDLVRIRPGEELLDYRVRASEPDKWNGVGTSLRDEGEGQMYCFIGQPTDRKIALGTYGQDQHVGHDPAYNHPKDGDRKWYNAHQRVLWDNIHVPNHVLQEAAPLSVPEASDVMTYTFVMQALFSGEGSNSELDYNQFMLTTRWIAQENMRAVRSNRTRRDNKDNPLFTATAGPNAPWQKFTDDGSPAGRTSVGSGHDWDASGKPVDAILFEFPYENQPLLSIGQLQHANLSLIGAYPSYPIGNSLADFRLPDGSKTPDNYLLVRTDRTFGNTTIELGVDQKAYYDISYLLNRTLWDRYFFSTIPTSGSLPSQLANPRHLVYNADKLASPDGGTTSPDPDSVAAGLMLEGGFNINSTSEQAWRAVLGGINQLEYDPENATSGSALKAAFPRFTRPSSDDDVNSAWAGGYRTLTEEQIAQLARNIVTEIRNRGPFVSLADFINRRLIDNINTDDGSSIFGTSSEHENYRGTIQAAIDRMEDVEDKAIDYPVNNPANDFWSDDEVVDKFSETQEHFSKGAYEKAMLVGADEAGKPYSNRSAFAPNYLTQADVLTAIGSSISARSDTFVIRGYGEVTDFIGEVRSQAWCEAVVQRYPEYVNESANNSEDAPAAISDLNRQFGRQFKIISFRWLSADEV